MPSLGRRGPSRAEAAMRGVGMGQQMPRATSSTEPHHQPSRLWADSEPVLERVAVARAMEIARGEVCMHRCDFVTLTVEAAHISIT